MKKKLNDSPLVPKVCACGCETSFQPLRSDQIYMNRKHANFAYNHGTRKEKYATENELTKIIRKNDRILEKYYKIFNQIVLKMNLVLVKADGFKDDFFTRIIVNKKGEIVNKYCALYKFCYRIIKQGDNQFIEIRSL